MAATETRQAERLTDDVCSTSVLLPAGLRADLGKSAKLNERSCGAEIRAALKAWLYQGEHETR